MDQHCKVGKTLKFDQTLHFCEVFAEVTFHFDTLKGPQGWLENISKVRKCKVESGYKTSKT